MKKKKTLFCVILLLAAFCTAALWQGIVVRNYEIETDKLISAVRILQISDLHSSIYGEQQNKLIAAIGRIAPDVVVLTGDIADDQVYHEGTKLLLEQIADEYPCFYVSGNHEAWCEDPDAVYAMIESYGVTRLCAEGQLLQVGQQTISVFGVDDPDVFDGRLSGANEEWCDQIARCIELTEPEVFSVLLSHRPELVQNYAQSGFDLVLSGHAHGGQVRLPFINGLWAPNQGFFPEYAGGEYALSSDTTLIVSRGLCKNNIPRVFNPPELVVIDLVPVD